MGLVLEAQLFLEPMTSCVPFLFLSNTGMGPGVTGLGISGTLSTLRHLCSQALVCFRHARKMFHALMTLYRVFFVAVLTELQCKPEGADIGPAAI